MKSVLVIFLFLAGAALQLDAQPESAVLTGAVLDPAGSALPNAKINVKAESGAPAIHNTVTSSDGRFSFPSLAPGAIGGILDVLIGGINGNIFGSLAAFGLYFGLFALLFRIAAAEMVACVMVIWVGPSS